MGTTVSIFHLSDPGLDYELVITMKERYDEDENITR